MIRAGKHPPATIHGGKKLLDPKTSLAVLTLGLQLKTLIVGHFFGFKKVCLGRATDQGGDTKVGTVTANEAIWVPGVVHPGDHHTPWGPPHMYTGCTHYFYCWHFSSRKH